MALFCQLYHINIDVLYTIMQRRGDRATSASFLCLLELIFIQNISWYIKVQIVIPKEITVIQNYTEIEQNNLYGS